VPVYLHVGRRADIAHGLVDGRDFYCHETVGYDNEDDDGETVPDTMDAVICAGAAKSLLAAGGSTQMMRIAERLGLADLDVTAERGPDVWDLNLWTEIEMGSTGDDWQYAEEAEVETCNTVNDGCLAPAGFLGSNGGVVRGAEAADGRCAECDEPLCSNCADSKGRCIMCTDEEDEYGDD
jgi:hypothetical protein